MPDWVIAGGIILGGLVVLITLIGLLDRLMGVDDIEEARDRDRHLQKEFEARLKRAQEPDDD